MVDTPGSNDPSGSAKEPRRPATMARSSLRSPNEALQPVPAPPPPRPVKRRRRPLIATASGILSFLGIAAIACVLAWSMGMQRINAAGPLTADKVVTVRPGNDVSVVDQLSNEGVIDNRLLMTAALWIEGNRGNVKSGEYLFKQSASLRDVIDTLVSGKQILHALTIPEGLTSEQVMARVRDSDVLIGDVSVNPGEGTLMPDTYKFARGTTRDQVIRSMQAEQKRTLAEVWSHRSPETPIRSPFELVTLASIVEKETGKADERPRVASVFINRLGRNMPLQSDPTIVYGLVGGKGTLGRGILKSEIEQKTPYNTYTNTGLPPGPIANPGKAAMEAVANPSRTRDLYFVADGTGGHAFADSLDQHRANVVRWRQIEKERLGTDSDKAPSPAAGSPPAPRPDQRGELDTNPGKFDDVLPATADAAADPAPAAPAPVATASAGPATALPTFALPNGGMSTTNPTLAGLIAKGTRLADAKPGRTAVPAATDGDFNELNIEVGGLKSRADPATWDGEGFEVGSLGGSAAGEPSGGGSMQTFPVSPQHLADQRARAVALGLLTSGDGSAAAPLDSQPPPAAPTSPGGIHLYGKGKIIDASEGTSFDPLRDKTYDLTTAKTVPAVKGLPPLPPLAAAGK